MCIFQTSTQLTIDTGRRLYSELFKAVLAEVGAKKDIYIYIYKEGTTIHQNITYNWRSQLHLKKIINQQECMGEPTLGYI